jgi:hypothetical protein
MSLPLNPAPDASATNSTAADQHESLGHPSSSLQAPSSNEKAYSTSPTSTINNDHDDISPSYPKRPTNDGRHESQWGENMHVPKPLSKDDPNFLSLQRSLTRSSRHSQPEWSLENELKSGKLKGQNAGEKR